MLDQEGLIRGHVRQVISECHRIDGCQVKEWHFDSDGRLAYFSNRASNGREFSANYHYDANGYRVRPDTQIEHLADGGRVEIQTLHNGVDAWSMAPLQGIAFGTGRSTTVETSFNAKGVPLRTTFRHSKGETESIVDYLCDEVGRILQAINYNGAAVAVGTEPKLLSALVKPGTERCRVTFRYDPAGQILEETISFAELWSQRTVYEYNDHGDPISSTTQQDDTPPQTVEFEYDYDERGNWVHQFRRHALGTDEIHRRLSYFD